MSRLRVTVHRGEIRRAARCVVYRLALVVGMLLCLNAVEVRAAGTLVNNGTATGCIVTPAGTTGKVQTAAQDLAGYLERMSGAVVPVVSDSSNPSGYKILIGSTQQSPVDPSDVTEQKAGFDGFIIKSVTGGVVIAGGDDQGTANGVYHFAEEVLGIHWYSVEDDGPTVPARSTVTIPDVNLTVKPDSAWRGQYFSFQQIYPEYANRTIPLAQKLAQNRDRWWTFNRLWGINAETQHTMSAIIPANLFNFYPQYFAYIDYTFVPTVFPRILIQADANGDLPYSPWYSGRHVGDASFQRCLWNPGVRSKAAFYTSQQFAADPTLVYASLSENDGPWWCTCGNCNALGTRSTQMVKFVNAVAALNASQYPEAGYAFLAYLDTIGPPVGVTVHPNAVPMIAPLWQCRIHPISSNCPDKVYLRQVYEGWDAASENIACYPYTTDAPFTFPGVIAMAEEMRYARDHGGIGGFREHQFKPAVNWQMLSWMEIKLLWDVDENPEALRRQFIEGYYGLDAADALERVFAGIEDGMLATVNDRTWPGDDGAGMHSLPPETVLKPIVKGLKLDIDAALADAQTLAEPYRSRVIRDMKALPTSSPLFYEGFDYPAGSTVGLEGGWLTYTNYNPYTIQPTGASYTDAAGNKLAVSGRSAYQTVVGDRYNWIKKNLTQEAAELFATEGTFYITMLLKEQNDIVFKTTSGAKYLDLGTYPQTLDWCYTQVEVAGVTAKRSPTWWLGTQYDLYAVKVVNHADPGAIDEITMVRNPNLSSPVWDTSNPETAYIQGDITADDYSYFNVWGGGQSSSLSDDTDWYADEWIGGMDEIRIAREWSNVAPQYTQATMSSARKMIDGEPVQCFGTVTAAFGGFFYIESSDRSSGIRIEKAGFTAHVGYRATVDGIMDTLSSGERCVAANTVAEVADSALDPLAMNNIALGGGDYGIMPNLGQRGVLDGSGLNNIGLLVKTTGRVGAKGTGWFKIDDGSGVSVKVVGAVPAGTPYVTVTGVSSCERVGGDTERMLLATRIQVTQ